MLDLGAMPLAGGFLSGPDRIPDEQRFPLRIHVCDACSLIQITDVVDPEILFQDYSFASSTVRPLIDHFEGYADWLVDRLAPATLIEFGCNDGILLAPLQQRGVKAVGVDVSANITELARERGLDVRTGFFDPAMAAALADELGPVDVVTGSNAFAHNEHPEKILEAASLVLADDGHLCLEVMYAGDLLELVQWDTLYHEHLTFYSLGTLQTLLSRHGYTVVQAERIPMHGGSLRIAATRSPSRVDDSVARVEAYEEQLSLNAPGTWTDFGRHVDRKIAVVRDVLGELSAKKRIWGYGAAGKATMWVNACGMDYLDGMVDASPLRAGKLMPGTHTPIVFPEEFRRASPDLVFITAWNYAPNIMANEDWFTGVWATPLPELRLY